MTSFILNPVLNPALPEVVEKPKKGDVYVSRFDRKKMTRFYAEVIGSSIGKVTVSLTYRSPVRVLGQSSEHRVYTPSWFLKFFRPALYGDKDIV